MDEQPNRELGILIAVTCFSSPKICLFLVVSIAGVACSEWPRFKNLPDSKSGESGEVDPRGLIDVGEYVELDELEENDSPALAQEIVLGFESGRAVIVTGQLDGVGWSDTAPELSFEPEECGGEGLVVDLTEPGGYIADVDYFIVEARDDGLLCARLTSDSNLFGWDLLAYTLDDCDVPNEMVEGPEGALGYGLGGSVNGWNHYVKAGDRLAVGLGGYSPNALDMTPDYSLGFTLIHSQSGDLAICPFNPDE